ncbi:MAG: peptide chain release factor-like protein [Planctomycetia bacterium]|nr:peptide chain release factor-like protein [Planctomycetia bacterium]
MHPAALPIDHLLAQTQVNVTKRTGPGGQHRNKVQTAVVLIHDPTGVSAEASERRSQQENRQVAIRRLRLRLALDHRTPAPGGPSPLWQSRVHGGRIVVAVTHDDYPALVAEALDHLAAHRLAMSETAAALGVTASQLAGLFRKEPQAWTVLNRRRAAAGLPVLK